MPITHSFRQYGRINFTFSSYIKKGINLQLFEMIRADTRPLFYWLVRNDAKLHWHVHFPHLLAYTSCTYFNLFLLLYDVFSFRQQRYSTTSSSPHDALKIADEQFRLRYTYGATAFASHYTIDLANWSTPMSNKASRAHWMLVQYQKQKILQQHRYYLRDSLAPTKQSICPTIHRLTFMPLCTATMKHNFSTPSKFFTRVSWARWQFCFSDTYTLFYSSRRYSCFNPLQTMYCRKPRWHLLVPPPLISNPPSPISLHKTLLSRQSYLPQDL